MTTKRRDEQKKRLLHNRVPPWVWWLGLIVSLGVGVGAWYFQVHLLRQTVWTDYSPPSDQAVWEGDWTFSAAGADPSEAGGDQVTISFIGTDLALVVRRGDYRGDFFVYVDGAPANRLPRGDAGEGGYLVLTSPDRLPRVDTIPVAAGLPDGPHRAVVQAHRGWDQWPLVGWRVGHTPDVPPGLWVAMAAAGLGALCCAAALLDAGDLAHRPVRRMAQAIRRRPASTLWPSTPVRPPVGKWEWEWEWTVNDRAMLPLIIVATLGVYISAGRLPFAVCALSAALLALLVIARLDWGLALVVATAPFYRYPCSFPFLGGKSFSLAEITMGVSLLSWGVMWLRRRPPVGDLGRRFLSTVTSLDLAVIAFAVIGVLSALQADFRHVALRELRVVILEPVLFYGILRTADLDARAVRRLVDALILSGVVVAVIGLVQYAMGVNVITAEAGFRRLRSVYGSPNNAGLYLGRVLPFAIAYPLFGTIRRRRVLYGLAVLPVALAIVLSFSKGALLLGVPCSLLVLGVLAGGRWLWTAVGAVVAAVATIIPLLRTPRFASLLDTRRGTTFFRLHLWRSSLMMLRDHLGLGVGPDNFLYQYRGRYILPAAWQEPDLSHAHNILLDYGCRLGLPGLFAGVWLQWAFWQSALPLRHGDQSAFPDRRAMALGTMASMAGFVAHGMVDASYFVIDLAFVFFLLLGLVYRLHIARNGNGQGRE